MYSVCESPLEKTHLLTCTKRRFHYENTPIQTYRKFHLQNLKIFRKKSYIFHIFAQSIDCEYSLEPPRRGGSNKYPHSMFLSRNKKYNVYTCKPQFYCTKMGFKWIKIIKASFRDEICLRTRAVWSEPLLSRGRNFASMAIWKRPLNILIRLCECAGCSESSLGAHVRR